MFMHILLRKMNSLSTIVKNLNFRSINGRTLRLNVHQHSGMENCLCWSIITKLDWIQKLHWKTHRNFQTVRRVSVQSVAMAGWMGQARDVIAPFSTCRVWTQNLVYTCEVRVREILYCRLLQIYEAREVYVPVPGNFSIGDWEENYILKITINFINDKL
jgi:hypothetical protein